MRNDDKEDLKEAQALVYLLTWPHFVFQKKKKN